MTPSVASFSPSRARAYVFRLPFCTRLLLAALVVFWLVGLAWDSRKWGALVPDEVNFANGFHRINTYPFIHIGLVHTILNLLALTPLLERFESEYGTLTTLALFNGPFSTAPAALYLVLQKLVLRSNVPIMGSSIWVFLLLGMEAVRNYKSNPHLVIGTHHIPTWTIPLFLVFVVSVLVPGTSLLGHLCGLAVGYICGLGYLKWLSPPDKVLRWVESKLNLLAWLPHYVSVDQKTYGRFGILPSSQSTSQTPPISLVGSQRLGP